MAKHTRLPVLTNETYTINQAAIALGISYDAACYRYRSLGGDIKDNLSLTDVINMARLPAKRRTCHYRARIKCAEDETKATNLMDILVQLGIITATDMAERIETSRVARPRSHNKTRNENAKTDAPEQSSKNPETHSQEAMLFLVTGKTLEAIRKVAKDCELSFVSFAVTAMLNGFLNPPEKPDGDIQQVKTIKEVKDA